MRGRGGERGQASVELVALLPLIAVVALVLWQAAVAGQAMWLAGTAARGAARAQAVGRDPAEAARRVLPARLEHGLRVRPGGGGRVAVGLLVPSVLTGGSLGRVTATTGFRPQAP